MNEELEDLYAILQVHPSAEPEVIEAAFNRLAFKYHPDRNKSPQATEVMKRLNRARDILRDPVKRAEYDRRRKLRPTSQERVRQAPQRAVVRTASASLIPAKGHKSCQRCPRREGP